jgi:hypothetical protein
MKLSDFSSEKGFEVLCEITPAIESIAKDEEVVEILNRSVDKSSMTVGAMWALLVERVSAFIPAILKTHRNDVYTVLSAVNEVSVEDIKAQNIMGTLEQVKELIQDEEFVRFFKSLRRQGKTE